MDVSIEGVSKRYFPTWALQEVSARIEAGTVVAVIGANGAGKTTLMQILAGLAAPRKGRIRYGGELFRRGDLALRRKLAYVPETPAVVADWSPIRWAATVLHAYGREMTPEVANELADQWEELGVLGLAEKAFSEMSRGQAYKAALGVTASLPISLLLLDEPFASGMDPKGIGYVQRLCRRVAAAGGIVVFTTQIVDLAESLATQTLVLDEGRLVMDATPAAVREGMLDGSLPALMEPES